MFANGFDVEEAKALISIIAELQGASPPLPQPPLPTGWTLAFDPPPIGAFNNKWQLWHDELNNRFAVIIRGTTNNPGSILEDLLSVMVDASGSLTLGKIAVDYKLADEPEAAVHLGFLLGTLLLLLDPANGIVAALSSRIPKGSDVFIAGHSQGAGIATLCRAFLNYSGLLTNAALNFKTYVFAQPKPGNDHFGDDFERVIGTSMMFRVTNDQDWVPQVPFTFELPRDINEPNPMDLLHDTPFGLISKLVESAHDTTARLHVAKLQGRMAELETVLGKQQLIPTRPATAGTTPIRPTLNFMGCGVEIVRAGTPGTNPDDPKDFMWQHHAAMYYELL